MKKFVIFSYQRTGSTYLVKILNNFEGVVCQSEIFHKNYNAFKRAFLDHEVIRKYQNSPFKRLIYNEERVFKKLFRMKNRNFHSFLKKIFQEKSNAVGFKIFPGQHDEAFDYLLREASIHKIILERRNRLRSYASEQISIKTGRWDRYAGEDPELVQIEIDIGDFLLYKQRTDAYLLETEQILKASGQKYLKLTYEEISQIFPYSVLIDFLGIRKKVQLKDATNQERQNPFSLEEMIINYKEVDKRLVKEGLQDYLAD